MNSAITQEIKDIFVELAFSSAELCSGMSNIQDKLKNKLKNEQDYVTEANLLKLGFYLSSVESITATADYLINQDNSRYNANARWVEQKACQRQLNIIW